MATMRQPRTSALSYEAPPGNVRFDWIMVLVTIWGMGGLFLDGWAHSNVPQLETFFTPWHAVLYSGYLAVAATLVIKTISNVNVPPVRDRRLLRRRRRWPRPDRPKAVFVPDLR